MTPENADRLICAAMGSEVPAWPGPGDAGDCRRFIERLDYHGMAPLLDRALASSSNRDSWPPAIVEHCRQSVRAQALDEMAGRRELSRVLEALDGAGIKPLLLKGTPLAYTHYESPVLRQRGDTDLLVPLSAKAEAEAVLARLGFVRYQGVTGEFISYQSLWTRTDDLGVTHELDLHWRINNSQVLAKLLDYGELEAPAVAVPALGAHAYALAPVHALAFACMHRAGHRNAPYYVDNVPYSASDRLIWLYDIHLLVSRMCESEVGEFVSLAVRKRMKAICHESLARAAGCFGTVIPTSVIDALLPSGPEEPSARFCRGTPASQFVEDWIALGTMGDRIRWLGEMAFPPADYMREKYSGTALKWLPLLYARRAFTGLWKLAR